MTETTPGTSESLQRRSEAKRADIIETAAEYFAERGFEKTSMKALAAAAQVSTSTIYSYFEDKTDLLEQTIRARMDGLLATAEQEMKLASDPLEALVRAARRVNRGLSNDPLLTRVFTFQRHIVGRRVREYTQRIADRIDDLCRESLRRVIANGDLECEDPEALTAVMRLAMQGWLLSAAEGAAPVSEKRMTEALLALIQTAAGRSNAY
ncbi:MAG: TetR/AcrR family transcriptional regulator [bacterium]|nr:TetR/AcrR family transcriptional regulator [bacterium]